VGNARKSEEENVKKFLLILNCNAVKVLERMLSHNFRDGNDESASVLDKLPLEMLSTGDVSTASSSTSVEYDDRQLLNEASLLQ